MSELIEGRICVKCSIEKPLDEFQKRKECRGGRARICKACENERAVQQMAQWRAGHPEQYQHVKKRSARRLNYRMCCEPTVRARFLAHMHKYRAIKVGNPSSYDPGNGRIVRRLGQ